MRSARDALTLFLRLRERIAENAMQLVGMPTFIGRVDEVARHTRFADEREAHEEWDAGDLGSHEDDVRLFRTGVEFTHDRGEIRTGCVVRHLNNGEGKSVVEDVFVVRLHTIDTEVDAVDLAVKRTTQFVGLPEQS